MFIGMFRHLLFLILMAIQFIRFIYSYRKLVFSQVLVKGASAFWLVNATQETIMQMRLSDLILFMLYYQPRLAPHFKDHPNGFP